MRFLNHLLFFGFLFWLSACDKEPPPEPSTPEILNEWNAIVFELAVAEDGLLTLKGLRTASMMHIAIHNALNTIDARFESYDFHAKAVRADPVAATSQAAYEVVVRQYSNQQEDITAIRDRFLMDIPEGERKTAGIELGRQAASAIRSARQEDRWNGEATYTWHPMAPGVYAEFSEHSGTPEGFVFGSGWAEAEPFMLDSASQFLSPPPPEIGSDAYAVAFNEVKQYGRYKSDKRTEDQAHLAMWWKDFVENSHNRLARELVLKEGLDLWQAGRMFALLNMVIYDSYICVFENKFHYNHWRPYTAIRWAAHDENTATEPDTSWNNLHLHTYAFPSYPSAHGCAGGAAMTVLAGTLGTGDSYSFTMTTAEVDSAGPFSGKMKMDPPTRSFSSFSEAAMEAGLSRIYLGIHFRYDSEEGVLLGQDIGRYALNNFLQPVGEVQRNSE